MESQEIDQLLVKFGKPTEGRTPDPRVKEVVDRVVRDLCYMIEDLDVSPSEFWTAMDYLTAVGKSQEFGLLIPGLGLEHFFDLRQDEKERAAGISAGGTPRTIEGPLYVPGAPTHTHQARIDDGADPGEPLFIDGQVCDEAGRPVPGAQVEVWHANSKGMYSIFDSSQSPFNLRGTILADDQGRYKVRTIVPSGYACPPDSATQQLLDLLGRHGARPAHVHYFVSAPGFRKLTTQINIADDPLIDDDFAFATRDGLSPPITRHTDPASLSAYGVDRPFATITFDLVMAADRAGLPSAEVVRSHATA